MLLDKKIIYNEDNSIGYIESIFNSDNVIKSIYFPTMYKLYIVFNRGGMYSYLNIKPELYSEFENSESQGKFFHANINNRKEFQYRKEFTLLPFELNEIKEIITNKKEDKLID